MGKRKDRAGTAAPEEKKVEKLAAEKNNKSDSPPAEPWTARHVLTGIWNIIGVCVGLAFAKHHTWYCYIQHENQMWFSNIKEVEREISFRTESGLYYSYYKQTIQAKFVKNSNCISRIRPL